MKIPLHRNEPKESSGRCSVLRSQFRARHEQSIPSWLLQLAAYDRSRAWASRADPVTKFMRFH
jgi:hypothetical protein